MAYEGPHPFPVTSGGTGDTSVTAYSVLCGGTTTTNPLQSVASLGNVRQVLTSNGAAALPTWQSLPASAVSFLVYLNARVNNFTGNTGASVLFDTISFDSGSNITLNSGGVTIFTAPVTGIYLFDINIRVDTLTNANTSYSFNIYNVTQAIFLGSLTGNIFNMSILNSFGNAQTSLVQCNAGDVINCFVSVSGGVGNTVGLTETYAGPIGGTTLIQNYFSGMLIAQTA